MFENFLLPEHDFEGTWVVPNCGTWSWMMKRFEFPSEGVSHWLDVWGCRPCKDHNESYSNIPQWSAWWLHTAYQSLLVAPSKMEQGSHPMLMQKGCFTQLEVNFATLSSLHDSLGCRGWLRCIELIPSAPSFTPGRYPDMSGSVPEDHMIQFLATLPGS